MLVKGFLSYSLATSVQSATKANVPTLAIGLPAWRITSCVVAKRLCC